MILTRFSCAVPSMGLVAMLFLAGLPTAHAQWLEWDLQTDSRLELSSVAQSDDEEKDMWPADLNKDGWTDVIVVRKEPFSAVPAWANPAAVWAHRVCRKPIRPNSY